MFQTRALLLVATAALLGSVPVPVPVQGGIDLRDNCECWGRFPSGEYFRRNVTETDPDTFFLSSCAVFEDTRWYSDSNLEKYKPEECRTGKGYVECSLRGRGQTSDTDGTIKCKGFPHDEQLNFSVEKSFKHSIQWVSMFIWQANQFAYSEYEWWRPDVNGDHKRYAENYTYPIRGCHSKTVLQANEYPFDVARTSAAYTFKNPGGSQMEYEAPYFQWRDAPQKDITIENTALLTNSPPDPVRIPVGGLELKAPFKRTNRTRSSELYLKTIIVPSHTFTLAPRTQVSFTYNMFRVKRDVKYLLHLDVDYEKRKYLSLFRKIAYEDITARLPYEAKKVGKKWAFARLTKKDGVGLEFSDDGVMVLKNFPASVTYNDCGYYIEFNHSPI